MKEIGGYFELELADRGPFPHEHGYCVNSGRNALELILSNIKDIALLWIPYYTCDVILEPLEKLKIPYCYYHINKRLELANDIQLNNGEYILVTNYFGIKDNYIKEIAERYGEKLIVDNSQAFFSPPIAGIKTFYSPRKFVGVPDGGIAIIPDVCVDMSVFERDTSFERCSHLLKRTDIGASNGYNDFKINSQHLKKKPIRCMSKLTRALLRSIDYEIIEKRRRSNYMFIHEMLNESNLLSVSHDGLSSFCPMIYPYLSKDYGLKQKLIDEYVFVATYWPNVTQWCNAEDIEYKLTQETAFLPIDQRYEKSEMEMIVKAIKQYKHE